MSFGYAIGDFVLLTQLAWDVVQNSRKACGAHDELTSEATSLHIVLRRLEIEVSKPNSILTRSDDGTDRREELAQLSEDCRRVLRTLDGILKKYNALSEEKRSVTKLWKKVQFGNGEMLDLAELRLKIATSTSALTLFLNLLSIGSQGKVESYMESQGDELKEMRKSLNWITASMQAKAPKAGEGSILTTYAGDDKAIWKDFRRELIREGFSSEMLERHMETIKDYVIELGNRGALDDVEDDTEIERLSLDDMVLSDEVEDAAKEDELDHSALRPQEVPEANFEQELVGKSGATLEASSLQEREHTPKQQGKTKSDDDGMQSPTERRNLDESSESNDDDVGGNGCETLVDKSQQCFEEPTNITLKSTDEHTSTNAEHTYSGVDLRKSISFLTIYHEPESSTCRAVRVNNVELPTVFVTRYNPPPTVDIRPHLIYSSKYCGGDVHFGHKWFGSYYNYLGWGLLSVETETALFSHQTAHFEWPFRYHPHAICYWMFIMARAYERVQCSDNLPTTPPKILSPLADELQLLVGRACAYYHRISNYLTTGKSQQHDQYTSRFLEILETLYLFIRGGLFHMLSLNEDKNAPETLWVFDRDLNWQQGKDWTVSCDTQNARPIFALTPKAAIDFVQGVFRDGHIVHFRDGSNRASSLAELVTELQFLLFHFKKSCEDDVLRHESRRRRPGEPDYLSSIPADEMQDTDVANAEYELKNCKIALEVWMSDNDYSKIEAKTERFATKKTSLSTLLERCDEAQYRLHRARLRFAVSRRRRAADRERNAKRGSKKRK
jgi:hypothetical protein